MPPRNLPSLILFSALWLVELVFCQQQAQCLNSLFKWSFNSLDQSPCTIAQSIGSTCPVNGIFTIDAAQPGATYYNGVDTICVCNTVYYNLIGVCAACQQARVQPWNDWIKNCTNNYQGNLPIEIPSGITIPHYAFQALAADGTVDLNAAQADKGAESPTQGSSKKKPVGAIVGGVIGGIAGVAIVVGIFLLVRRRGKRVSKADERGTSSVPDKVSNPEDLSGVRNLPSTPAGGNPPNSSYATASLLQPSESVPAAIPPDTSYSSPAHHEPQRDGAYHPPHFIQPPSYNEAFPKSGAP